MGLDVHTKPQQPTHPKRMTNAEIEEDCCDMHQNILMEQFKLIGKSLIKDSFDYNMAKVFASRIAQQSRSKYPNLQIKPRTSTQLEEHGFTPIKINDASQQAIAIQQYLDQCTALYKSRNYPHDAGSLGIGLAHERPDDAVIAQYDFRDVICAPGVINLLTDSSILGIVAGHLGCTPVISDVTAWWSFPYDITEDNSRLYGSQTFHRDRNCFKFCKLFYYLTDVDGEAGPHMYVPQTANLDAMVKRMSFDGDIDQFRRLVFNVSYLQGKIRDQIHPFLEKNAVAIMGDKGSCFIEDTYGFHRGERPIKKPRLVLEVLYLLVPQHSANILHDRPHSIEDLNKVRSFIEQLPAPARYAMSSLESQLPPPLS